MRYQVLILVLVFNFSFFAQEITTKKNSSETNSINKLGSPQAVEGDIIFSDGNNQLMRITDEGNFGAIQLQNGVPQNVMNKIYSNNGILYFDTTALNSGIATTIDSLDQLTDAKTDFSSIYIGRNAGQNDDGGLSDGSTNNNAGFGRRSLKSNTTGRSNTSIGNASMLFNTIGNENTSVGNAALAYNTSGFNNIALGSRSLYINSTGYFNVGIGYQVGYYNQEGINNTFVGSEAGKGQAPHSKSGGVFLGFQAGFNEEGDNKLYINNDSSSSPLIYGDFTDGNEIVKINGDFHVTGNITTDGAELGAVVINDLSDSKFDGESLFIGDGAGINDDGGISDGTKNFNLGIGRSALNSNSTGDKNIALGNETLFNNTAGSRNTVIGATSMHSNTTGSANVALGFQSNYFNETGSRNTLVGNKAGYGSAGNNFSDNIFIGYQAGYNETGSNLLYIENSDSDTPLIWGDFLDDQVKVNGSFLATTKIQTPIIKLTNGAADGHILTSDSEGNAAWKSPEKIGFSGYLEYNKREFLFREGDNSLTNFIELYDLGEAFDPATGEFTAPFEGFYQFLVNVVFLDRSTDYIATVKIKKNGIEFPGSSYQSNISTFHDAHETVSFSVNIYLMANDVITAWFDAYNPILPTGGGVIADPYETVAGGNDGYSTTFSGFKIH